MTLIQITEREKARLLVLGLVMLAGLALLALTIWFIQLGQGHVYRDSQEQQSVRRVRLPAVRGAIVDRNGVCLADNQPDYGICIYMEELRRTSRKRQTAQKAWELVQRMSQSLGVEPQTTLKQINAHLYNRKPLPMPVWRHIDHGMMARFAELAMQFPAADIMLDSKRVYPSGKLAAHIIGYVGAGQAAEDDDDDLQYHYYLPDVEGKTGLERYHNKWLAGDAGGRLVRIDVTGYKHDETCIREPVPGKDLRLALDARFQRLAEEAIADTCGAVVVVDPQTGDILAMASEPAFDINMFCSGISPDTWKALATDERKPLFNRAGAGMYPPGSTFKPLIAITALMQGKVAADQVVDCNGYFDLGNQTFSCPVSGGHGSVDLARALEVSCNVFFYKLGLQCGYDAIYHMALAAGFGTATGLDLNGESAGFMPSKAWKRRVKNETWRDGDTCNISVGQGALLVTPLQMAVFTGAIANGGRLYRPRLVIGRKGHDQAEFEPVAPVLERDLHWPREKLAIVSEGMRRVVNEPSGTGRQAALPDVIMAGKTGTAEFGRKGSGQKHGWMILYAPYENPKYAVAMVVDEAVSGGSTVAPRLQRMMSGIFSLAGGES